MDMVCDYEDPRGELESVCGSIGFRLLPIFPPPRRERVMSDDDDCCVVVVREL